LEGLPPGRYRMLEEREVDGLRKALEEKTKNPRKEKRPN
jgi:hypothetical protein